MGFGISNILNKYVKPALISWESTEIKKDMGTYTAIDIFPGGSLKVDVKVSENHRFQNNITEQTMEDGSVVAEHAINTPTEITLQFEETNNSIRSGGVLGGAFLQNMLPSWMQGGPIGTFNTLKELAENRIKLTITTQHSIYENMIIKNMPILHRAPYRNALQVSCDLIQLNFSQIQTFSYKAKNLGTAMSAMGNISSGQVVTKAFGG